MATAEVNGIPIRYEDSGGDGPAVLFSHGFLMDHTMFDAQVEALSGEYRCIRWDERGFGDTPAPEPFTYWDSAADAAAFVREAGTVILAFTVLLWALTLLFGPVADMGLTYYIAAVLLGAVGGRDILQTNSVEWRWVAGILGNREEYTGLEPNSSLEALLGTYFNFFTFGDWENDLSSSLLVYPSLTESGRIRADFDISYRQDLFSDFYVRFSFYDQYDSSPPEGASNNDFGTTIAVGWDW